jgi:CYTH domain-containing protein
MKMRLKTLYLYDKIKEKGGSAMSEKLKIGLEIERKYIIEMPTVATLAAQENYTESSITQIYISSALDETRRVRRRVYPDRTEYYETSKRRVDHMSSDEREREITSTEYELLAEQILADSIPVVKMRYTFVYIGQTFEIDVYPQWKHTAIMETELSTHDTVVTMPPFLRIIREVTGDKAYSNAAMSRKFPPEDK